MRAAVTFELEDGSRATLAAGDLIGRVATAALRIDDARISEAHALVSLRGGDLCLLALRGQFEVEGQPVTEVGLRPGLRVHLAADLSVDVLGLSLPTEVLGVRGQGLATQLLHDPSSLVLHPRPALVARFQPDAAAWFWSTDGRWRVRSADHDAQEIAAGSTFTLEDRTFEAVAVPLARAGAATTDLEGAIGAPLQLVTEFDSVQVLRPGHPPLSIAGIPARIVCELAATRSALSWQALAREIWRDGEADWVLRKRLDVHLGRLRSKLRAGRVRADLVRADGTGKLQINLGPHDRVEDRG